MTQWRPVLPMLAASLALHAAAVAAVLVINGAGWLAASPAATEPRAIAVALFTPADVRTPASAPAYELSAGSTLAPALLPVAAARDALWPSEAAMSLSPQSPEALAPTIDGAEIAALTDAPALVAGASPSGTARSTDAGDSVAVRAVVGATRLSPGDGPTPTIIGTDPAATDGRRAVDDAEALWQLAALQNPAPRYPPFARRRGLEGRTILEVEVLEDGSPGDLRVVSSSGHALLDRAALAAVKKWAFRPARRGGRAVRALVRIPVRFQLTE